MCFFLKAVEAAVDFIERRESSETKQKGIKGNVMFLNGIECVGCIIAILCINYDHIDLTASHLLFSCVLEYI